MDEFSPCVVVVVVELAAAAAAVVVVVEADDVLSDSLPLGAGKVSVVSPIKSANRLAVVGLGCFAFVSSMSNCNVLSGSWLLSLLYPNAASCRN